MDTVVIVICCHGQCSTGNFSDFSGAEKFGWTPKRLWLGFKHRDTNTEFMGLQKMLESAQAKTVHIVAAQCYGAIFSARLQRVVAQHPATREYNLNIEGLSAGKTKRIRGPDTAVSNIATHLQLMAWIQVNFKFRSEELEDVYEDVDSDIAEPNDDCMQTAE